MDGLEAYVKIKIIPVSDHHYFRIRKFISKFIETVTHSFRYKIPMMKSTSQKSDSTQVILFHEQYESNTSFDQFLELLFYREMRFFASDLLEKGLDAADIQEAVNRAMLIGKTAGLDLRRHFTPIYTPYQGTMIKDCKLSKLGYALVLLNARASSPLVANLQLQVLENFFAGENTITTH